MIFPFFKKQKEKKRGPVLKVDLHSHFIPGIDDGSQSMEESLSLLKGMESLGYEKVITTPHIMIDVYRNTPQIIKEGLVSLRKAAKAEGIKLEIEAAAEYYLDEGFYDHIRSDEVMSIDGKYLLFETSYVSKPLQIEEMIFEISAAGYIPLMAHPERYRYVSDPLKEYGRWKELGVLFQLDLNSLGGHYGKDAKKKAEILSDNGMIDFLGSDVHHLKQTKFLDDVFQRENYTKVWENNTILNHTLRS
ncbi:capsular polysaccharide biosynthesis protein [Sulfurovum sp. TSL6]|uniref:tyrosine-protein phosphatase n=1 Tax=Sulfurovum sp. TSL6 TaxID=2826995 RepID=UPI001CC4DB4A|nr:CpsB/CapC family capsule biosynthesis tyrosine phosphatase [Sulfurovum sp. TSL6]GIU00518.1 capsular polysaccharide biosynthesis protein [Sulfurovum sp. TSL6]